MGEGRGKFSANVDDERNACGSKSSIINLTGDSISSIGTT